MNGPVTSSVGVVTVLVVDDEELVRMALEDGLLAAGFAVTPARSADEAHDMLGRGCFELMISDIVMPGTMDGIDLARFALLACPSMPIILTSGHTDRLGALAELMGRVEFLPKPSPLEAMLRLAAQLTGRAAASPAPKQPLPRGPATRSSEGA